MNTNETVKKKSFSKAIIIVVVLAVIVLGVGFAYARYITKLNGNATADIAKWSLKINGNTNQNFVIDLAQTRTGVTQEAEVEGNYIGPGTAGAFEIELDATGSEASLEYDINLNVNYTNNEVFPKNLIFYSDEEMTNAIYHDGNGINLNGFIGWNDNSQVHTKTIYWSWSYETGSTQNEINANDELDSYWIGKPISLSMNVTAKQVNENPTTGQYAVTFDSNGGTLQGYGNSSQATKMVTYGNTYGNLPTPTREGYTFKGWNGKNLFDFSKWMQLCKITAYGTIIKNTDSLTLNSTNQAAYTVTYYAPSMGGYGDPNALKIYLKNNTTYTFSWDTTLPGKSEMYIFLDDKHEGGYIFHSFNGKLTFTTHEDTEFIRVRFDVNQANSSATFSNVQLEEGSTATAYEPYYITPSTEVVKNQNHTLTAIWEKEN